MKILLIKLNHLGDTLLLTPTIRNLRERFPEARIDVMVRRTCEVVLENNSDISHVIPIAPPERSARHPIESLADVATALRHIAFRRYDYAFDLSNSDRAKFWIALSLAKSRGINVAYDQSRKRRLLFNRFSSFKWSGAHQVERDWETIRDIMQIEGRAGPLVFQPNVSLDSLRQKLPQAILDDDFVVIHPTSRWPHKQWTSRRWAEVADSISREHSLNVIFSCGPAPREIASVKEILACSQEKHAATEGQITIPELGALLQRAKLFLGVDTVAMHLAAAVNTPSVALFGPSSESSWHPWKTAHQLVLGDCTCKPTRVFTCDFSQLLPCMNTIKPDAVIAAARKLLSTP